MGLFPTIPSLHCFGLMCFRMNDERNIIHPTWESGFTVHIVCFFLTMFLTLTLFLISRSGLCSRIIRQVWKARRSTACLMTRCRTVSSSVVVLAFTSLPVFRRASMTATMSSLPLVATTCSGRCPS